MAATPSSLSSSAFRTTEPAKLSIATAVPFLSSTLRQLKTSGANSSLFGNGENVAIDLLMVLPRFAHRAASFAFFTVPEQMSSLGMGLAGFRDESGVNGSTSSIGSLYNSAASAAGGVAGDAAGNGPWNMGSRMAGGTAGGANQVPSFHNVRGFGGVFSYITSPWAILCVFMAIALNRTQIYASLRRPLSLTWPIRLALRIVPIVLFLVHILKLFRAIRCQTCPDFAELKYGNSTEYFVADFTLNGGVLHKLTSTLLFFESDRDSCLAMGMIPENPLDGSGQGFLKGSLSILWPLFQTLCLSQFIETLSCAVQARTVQTEMGMTIFEQSLAFAESEAMATNRMGWGPFGIPPPSALEHISVRGTKGASIFAKSILLSKLNTPPEVLFIALISSMNHLSSHILGVLGWQSRYRLLNSGVWGICFMGAFVWSVIVGAGDDIESGLLRFPTVCIVGFIPHILILMGISICGLIYIFALLLSTINPPYSPETANMTIRQRFKNAHENLQANVQLSSLRISMHEEFYTSLLKIGFIALTAASEAVYLNEGRAVEVRRWTWLDEERLRDVSRQRQRTGWAAPWIPPVLLADQSEAIAHGIGLVEETLDGSNTQNPYDRERKAQRVGSKNDRGASMAKHNSARPEGTGRWVLAWEFVRGILSLLVSWSASATIRTLNAVGITWHPRWLSGLAMVPKEQYGRQRSQQFSLNIEPRALELWSGSANLNIWDEKTDVETEIRKRLLSRPDQVETDLETQVDATLYSWWLNGGWWGSEDASKDWLPEDRSVASEQDDNVSVASFMTDTSEWMDDESVVSSGQRTPTQEDFRPEQQHQLMRRRQKASNTDISIGTDQLLSLIDPKSPEERSEAKILARHLVSSKPLTRSAFAKEEARILFTSLGRRSQGGSKGKLSPHEEALVLERLILQFRLEKPQVQDTSESSAESWESGAAGLGSSGPQCVVCQSSPRTILIWPCRCLALCEDCRVSLAMNNFATCVCCRRDVVAFSRLYVP
jgi:hypothetical protein